jgi:DNA-binding transcriptional LysR family regulator
VLGPEIAEILRRYREAHPSVQVMLHDLPPAEQQQLIAEGRMDAGFVGLIPNERPAGMKFVPWRNERLLVFVPSGHKFAPLPAIALGDLQSESLVAVSGQAAPAFSTLILGLCRKAGFRPRIALESARAQAVAVMVAAGSGIAILPESLAAYTGTSIVGVPIKGAPTITHVFALPSKKPSEAMNAFLKVLTHKSRITDE